LAAAHAREPKVTRTTKTDPPFIYLEGDGLPSPHFRWPRRGQGRPYPYEFSERSEIPPDDGSVTTDKASSELQRLGAGAGDILSKKCLTSERGGSKNSETFR